MPRKKRSGRWRDAFGPDEVIQRIRPAHTDEYLNNPHKGITTFQRFQGDPLYPHFRSDDTHGPILPVYVPDPVLPNKNYVPWTRVAYCRWTWWDMEPEKGRYNWPVIDNALVNAAARRQTLQIRIQPYTCPFGPSPFFGKRRPPGTAVDVPYWFWDTGVRWMKGRGGVFHPDCNDPRYIEVFGRFIAALGDRYNGHPDLESVDMGLGGFWGEGGGNISRKNADILNGIFIRHFSKTQLAAMIESSKFLAPETMRKHRIGYRADGFMDPHFGPSGYNPFGPKVVPPGLNSTHMFDAFPRQIAQYGLADVWQFAPMLMEPYSTLSHLEGCPYDIDWMIEQSLKYHPSTFMNKSTPIPAKWADKITAFNKKLGYRFHMLQTVLPLEAKPSTRMKVSMTIDNQGVAPLYRPYRFAFRFSQGKNHCIVPLKSDVRTWLPDYTYIEETLTVPKQLKRGEARVSCAIINSRKEAVVRLAIKAIDPDGWHPLTSMDIT